MAIDLRGDEARRLAGSKMPRARQHSAQIAITVVTMAMTALLLTEGEPVLCTEQAPCLPDPIGAVAVGALFAASFVGWLHHWTAAVAATIFAAGISERLTQIEDALFVFGYAAAIWLLAWLADRPSHNAEVDDWRSRTLHRTPPPTINEPALPHPILRTMLLAAMGILAGLSFWLQYPILRTMLLAAMGILAGLSFWLQYQSDHAPASTVQATVLRHVDGQTIELRYSDITSKVDVLNVNSYPVGSTIGLTIDDQDVIRPIAEPYDATSWLSFATLLGLPGLALHWRHRRRIREMRRLVRDAQPASNVWHAPYGDAIYATDAARYDHPIGTLLSPQRLSISRADVGKPAVAKSAAQQAVLYGVPSKGTLVAVGLQDGTLLLVGRFGPSRPDLHLESQHWAEPA